MLRLRYHTGVDALAGVDATCGCSSLSSCQLFEHPQQTDRMLYTLCRELFPTTPISFSTVF
jgi:hypothetical protein